MLLKLIYITCYHVHVSGCVDLIIMVKMLMTYNNNFLASSSIEFLAVSLSADYTPHLPLPSKPK